MTTAEIKKQLTDLGVALPRTGSGKNAQPVKADLLRLLDETKAQKASGNVLLRDILPNEMFGEIALRTSVDAIADLLHTDIGAGRFCSQ